MRCRSMPQAAAATGAVTRPIRVLPTEVVVLPHPASSLRPTTPALPRADIPPRCNRPTYLTRPRSRTEEGTMRSRTVRTLAVVLGLAPAAVAWKRADDSILSLRPGSRVWIEGTSTVRAFRCTADSVEARVVSTGRDAVSAVMAGAKAVLSAELRVPAARLECRNGTMKALKAAEHPDITFTVSSYELGKRGDAAEGSATGELTLGGVRKTITVVGAVTARPDGALRIVGTHELRMTEFGLKPPSLMMGTMKVRELVVVGFDLLLQDAVDGIAASAR